MVEVVKLCIMPDHLHMIVRIREDMPEGAKTALTQRPLWTQRIYYCN